MPGITDETEIRARPSNPTSGSDGLATEIARRLNRKRLSAAPCNWLSAISLFVDEEYENFDYDMIAPRTKLAIIKVLESEGYHLTRGNVLEGAGLRIEFPRPTRSLAGDPAAELERVVDGPAQIAFATPTQILLATWRREGPELSSARKDDLLALVYEQPANLDKIADWLRRTQCASDYASMLPQLVAAQEEGTSLRRRGAFRSRLPR